MIKSAADAETACDLVEALTGCLEGTPEESALIDRVFKLEIWEAKEWWRGTGRPPGRLPEPSR